MIAFTLFGRPIYRYGIFYFISFIIGYFFLSRIGKTNIVKKFPALQETLTKRVDTLLLFIVIGVLVGGRLGHVLIYDAPYYLAHLSKIIAVWEGGMSFIGGGIGVIIALLIFRKAYSLPRKEFFLLFDCIFVMVPFGIFFWRLGNYLNQELYGIPFEQVAANMQRLQNLTPTLKSLNLLHIYPKIDQLYRINTNLLSMLFEGITLFIINLVLFLKQKKKQKFIAGKITATFLIGYSFIRFRLEYLRADSQLEFVGAFTKSQRVFLASFLAGIIVYNRVVKRPNQ